MNAKIMATKIYPTSNEPGKRSEKNVSGQSSEVVKKLPGARRSGIARHCREAAAHGSTVWAANEAGCKDKSW